MSFLKKLEPKNKTSPKTIKKAFDEQPLDNLWTEEEVRAALDSWVDEMRTGEPISIGNMYARDASFIGTIAEGAVSNTMQIYAYFEEFLKDKKDLNVIIDCPPSEPMRHNRGLA
jgi:hypothetical protein